MYVCDGEEKAPSSRTKMEEGFIWEVLDRFRAPQHHPKSNDAVSPTHTRAAPSAARSVTSAGSENP